MVLNYKIVGSQATQAVRVWGWVFHAIRVWVGINASYGNKGRKKSRICKIKLAYLLFFVICCVLGTLVVISLLFRLGYCPLAKSITPLSKSLWHSAKYVLLRNLSHMERVILRSCFRFNSFRSNRPRWSVPPVAICAVTIAPCLPTVDGSFFSAGRSLSWDFAETFWAKVATFCSQTSVSRAVKMTVGFQGEDYRKGNYRWLRW